MTADDRIHALSQALVQAYPTGPSLPAPVPSAPWQDALADADQAYAVQERVAVARGCPADGPALHWKSGGGSRESWLTHAALAPSGVHQSPADVSDQAFHKPGVEAEIALRLGQPVSQQLAQDLTPDTVAPLVAALAVSIEIVDSRWAEGSRAPVLLRLADAQSHGGLVLGDWQPFAAHAWDWTAQRCEVTVGDQPPVVRVGTHPLGDPLWGVAVWLRHLTRHGQTVAAGTVVTTGAWAGLMPVHAGQRVRVAFPGIGAVSVQF